MCGTLPGVTYGLFPVFSELGLTSNWSAIALATAWRGTVAQGGGRRVVKRYCLEVALVIIGERKTVQSSVL